MLTGTNGQTDGAAAAVGASQAAGALVRCPRGPPQSCRGHQRRCCWWTCCGGVSSLRGWRSVSVPCCSLAGIRGGSLCGASQECGKPRAWGQAGTHQRSWTAGWHSWSCGSGQSGKPPRGWTGSVRAPLAPLESGESAGLAVGPALAIHACSLTEAAGVGGGGQRRVCYALPI